MVTIRTLTRGLLALAAFAPLLGAGCQSLTKASTEVKQAVHLEKVPATQVVCLWQRQLTSLNDPIKDGGQTRGIPGQMFLIDRDGAHAEVAGDLTIVVYDETPRSAGAQAQRPEVWHYTKDTLKRLVTADEKFGKTYALFLPWPSTWKDVTKVKVMARYQAPGMPDLFTEKLTLTIDFSDAGTPVWTDPKTGQPLTGSGGSQTFDSRSVPDATKMLKEMQAGGMQSTVTPTKAGDLVPPGFPAPTTNTAPTNGGWPTNLAPYSPGANVGPNQPIIINRN